MTTETILATMEPILSRCDMRAKMDGGTIKIYDKKTMLVGHLSPDGEVCERRLGKQNLLGALLKRQLTDALEATKGEKIGPMSPKENAISQIRAAMKEHGIVPSDLL